MKQLYKLPFQVIRYLTCLTLAFPVLIHAQSDTLHLQILDHQQYPLIGVNVTSDDGRFKGTSDIQGVVTIPVFNSNAAITFSYVGYNTITRSIEKLKQTSSIIRMTIGTSTLPIAEAIGRRDDHLNHSPQQISVINSEQIQRTSASTSADMLSQHGGLFVQKSQLGGGSPIIRGFEANRVLLVVDGVRMNNAIYRSGHLQNAITVDANMLERTEVLYGPGSLMYGSDALGGVVYFRTKSPKLNFNDTINTLVEGQASVRLASAEQSYTTHLDFNLGYKKWAFLTSATYADFGHLISGKNHHNAFPDFGLRPYFVETVNGKDVIRENDNPHEQIGSGYHQYDLLQKIRFQPNHKIYFDLNLQYSNSSNIPRYDQLTEPDDEPQSLKFAEWYYGPQNRFMAALRSRILKSNSIFDRANFIAAYQRIKEDRYQRKFDRTWTDVTLVDLDVLTLTADFDKYLNTEQSSKLAYGLDIAQNYVHALGFSRHITTNDIANDVNPRYPGAGSSSTTFGAYVNYSWQSPEAPFSFNLGGRFSHTSLFSRFDEDGPIQWPTVYQVGIRNNSDAITWSAGMNYTSPENWIIKMAIGTAFRAPNIDDFSKVREKNGFVTVPNTSLRPEKSFNTELTIGKQINEFFIGDLKIEGISLSATGFYTRLNDAIVRSDFFLPNGDAFFVSRQDTLFVQANVNADFANIYGISGNIQINFNDQFQLHSGINWTKGDRSLVVRDQSGQVVIDEIVPQDHIPPLYGQTSFRYRGKKLDLEATARYNGRKKVEDYAVSSIEINVPSECGNKIIDRTGTADNIETGVVQNATSPCASPYYGVYSWMTVNLYSSYRFHKRLSVNFNIENLFDKHYRVFASGISAPGRNFVLSLRTQF